MKGTKNKAQMAEREVAVNRDMRRIGYYSDAVRARQSRHETACSPTGIIRSGCEGIISALQNWRHPCAVTNLYIEYLAKQMEPSKNNNYLELALRAAAAASHELLNHLGDQNESLVIRAKRDGSLVSSVDLESHHIIQGILSEIDIPIISEEGNLPPFSERKDWPMFWLVDPLDGTESYLKSRSGFAVNIALCDANGPFLGVIADPLADKIYAGAVGIAPFTCSIASITFRNAIQQLPAVEPFLLVTSWNESVPWPDLLPAGLNPDQFTSKPLSGALKFCHIVTGQADVHVRSGSYMEWDCAAGDGLLKSIGLQIRSRDTGLPLAYNSMSLRVGGLWASRFHPKS